MALVKAQVQTVLYTIEYKRQLGTSLQRHTAGVKLATAVLFLGIDLWLTYGPLHLGHRRAVIGQVDTILT